MMSLIRAAVVVLTVAMAAPPINAAPEDRLENGALRLPTFAAEEGAPAAQPTAKAEPEPKNWVEWEKKVPYRLALDFAIVSDYIWRGINFSEHQGERGEELNYQLGTRLELAGDTVYFKSMTASVNDQKFSLEGKTIKPIVEPKAQLKITSSDLDLDRLLPFADKKSDDKKASSSSRQDEKPVQLAPKHSIEPRRRAATAQIQDLRDRAESVPADERTRKDPAGILGTRLRSRPEKEVHLPHRVALGRSQPTLDRREGGLVE